MTEPTVTSNIDELYGPGYTTETEYRIDTYGGQKLYRYADVAVLDPTDQPAAFYQVGKTTQVGLPVARERYALRDISEYSRYGDTPLHYVAYSITLRHLP